MNAKISEDELQLLASIREHAEGYGEEFPVDVDAVQKAIGFDSDKLWKCLSYIREHRLVRLDSEVIRHSRGTARMINGLYLTGVGENYMRELEDALDVKKKLTAIAVKEVWPSLKDFASQALAQIVAAMLTSPK